MVQQPEMFVGAVAPDPACLLLNLKLKIVKTHRMILYLRDFDVSSPSKTNVFINFQFLFVLCFSSAVAPVA